MSAIATSLTTLTTTWITSVVYTNNRMLDTGIISLCSILVGLIITKLNSLNNRTFRNYLREWWYWHKDPYVFKGENYELHTYEEISDDESNRYMFNMKKEQTQIALIFMSNLIKNKPIITEKKSLMIIKMTSDCKYHPSKQLYYPIYMKNGFIVYWFNDMRSGYYDNTYTFVSESKDNIANVLLDLANFIKEETEKNTRIVSDKKPLSSFTVPVNPKEFDTALNDTTKFIKSNGFVNTRRTFDTLVYEEKDKLVSVLDKFKNNTMYSSKLSLDNKLGILLYGPPGTGKTGTVTAIANHIDKGIIQINLTDVIVNGLIDVVLSREIYEKYVLVFDEFDHMMIEHFKVSETKDKGIQSIQSIDNCEGDVKETSKIDWSSVLAVSSEEERKEVLAMMKETIQKKKEHTKTDFGYFLSKLDGLEDSSGRVMIFCTNNPQILKKSYPALFRPGRIDLKLCLNNCTQYMYEKIIIHSLELEDTESIRESIRNADLVEYKWSPLDVINIALTEQTLDKTLYVLKNSSPDNNLDYTEKDMHYDVKEKKISCEKKEI